MNSTVRQGDQVRELLADRQRDYPRAIQGAMTKGARRLQRSIWGNVPAGRRLGFGVGCRPPVDIFKRMDKNSRGPQFMNVRNPRPSDKYDQHDK